MGKEPWRLCGLRTHLLCKENGHVSEEEGTKTQNMQGLGGMWHLPEFLLTLHMPTSQDALPSQHSWGFYLPLRLPSRLAHTTID